jgi:15-cis-phytoene synthase
MTPDLVSSYAYCERLARREAGNFYFAFCVLPKAQRLAMCALYAFMRVADDLADNPTPDSDNRLLLQEWRRRWHLALTGDYSHRLHPAFHHTVTQYGIPHRYIEDVIDGVTMDIDVTRYATFCDLYPYCYRVASAVGLSCIHIWGFKDESAKVHAEAAGIALQLTNILRDLHEDAGRGRIYLPQEDLKRFHYDEEELKRGIRNPQFVELMRFQVERAREYYESAWPLVDLLHPPGRAVYLTLLRTYRSLLELIVRKDFDVFSRRLSLSKWRKAFYALRSFPVRWGIA